MLGCTNTGTLVAVSDSRAVRIRAKSPDDEEWVQRAVDRTKAGEIRFAESTAPLLGADGIVRSTQVTAPVRIRAVYTRPSPSFLQAGP